MTKDEALRMVLKNLKIIEAQDQGCGGNVTEAEAWRSAKRIAWHTINFCEEALETKDEPVAWRYKPVREDNPRWEYTTQHPLDMGDGYIRPSLVEYCKCIEPLYAKKKPKLMLEKFKEMESLLDEPPQRTWVGLKDDDEIPWDGVDAKSFARAIEAKLKEKNT